MIEPTKFTRVFNFGQVYFMKEPEYLKNTSNMSYRLLKVDLEIH